MAHSFNHRCLRRRRRWDRAWNDHAYSGKNYVADGFTDHSFDHNDLITYLNGVKGAGNFAVSTVTELEEMTVAYVKSTLITTGRGYPVYKRCYSNRWSDTKYLRNRLVHITRIYRTRYRSTNNADTADKPPTPQPYGLKSTGWKHQTGVT